MKTLSVWITISSLSLLVDAYYHPFAKPRRSESHSPVKHCKKQVVFRLTGNRLSPSEVVDYVEYMPNGLGELDFAETDRQSIDSILQHLSEEKQAILKVHLGKIGHPYAAGKEELRSSRLRKSAGGGEPGLDVSWSCRRRTSEHSFVTPIDSSHFHWQPAFLEVDVESDEEEVEVEASSSPDWAVSQGEDDVEEEIIRSAGNVLALELSDSDTSDSFERDYRAFAKMKPKAELSPRHRSGSRSPQLDEAGFRELGQDRYCSPPPVRKAKRGSSHRTEALTVKRGASRVHRRTEYPEQPVRTGHRPSEHFRGIANTGNICYISSLIQALFHLPQVRMALMTLYMDDVPFVKREGVKALQGIFDQLDKPHLKQQATEFHITSTAIKLKAEELKYFSKHAGQGDVSEVLMNVLDFASDSLQPLFEGYMYEAIMEDRPLGFLFTDHWIKSNVVQLNVCDFQFKTLQDFLNTGMATAVSLGMDRTDDRHLSFLQERTLESVEAIRYANLVKPAELICFHLVRYRSTGSAPDSVMIQSKTLEYPDELTVAQHKYHLQSVVVHEPWGGNYGHYYTIAQTTDEREPWIELNDAQVSVVTKAYALSKTSHATLLFYARQQDDESELAHFEEADLSGLPFIRRDKQGTSMVRQAVLEAVPFSKDFNPKPKEAPVYTRYAQEFDDATIRHALSMQKTLQGEGDMVALLRQVSLESKRLAKEALLIDFPDQSSAIESLLEEHKGDARKVAEILRKQQSLN